MKEYELLTDEYLVFKLWWSKFQIMDILMGIRNYPLGKS